MITVVHMSLRIASLVVALLSPDAVEGEAVEPQAPLAEAPALRVGDTVLRGAEGDCVVLTVAADGAMRVGRLEAIGDDVVVLGQASGLIVEVDRRAIYEVRFAVGEEKSQCRVVEPPSPVFIAPSPGGCSSDDDCEEPRVCNQNKCVVEPGYVLELQAEGHARRKAGHRMLIAGPILAVVGVIMVPVGAVVSRGADDTWWGNNCYGNTGSSLCEEADQRRDRGTATWGVGTAILVAGVATTIVGGILTGRGNSKLRRAKAYHQELGLGPGSLRVRF